MLAFEARLVLAGLLVAELASAPVVGERARAIDGDASTVLVVLSSVLARDGLAAVAGASQDLVRAREVGLDAEAALVTVCQHRT